MGARKKIAVGDWVEVRSKKEILRTLDAKGQLDGMPFMPEMFQFCGKRFRVYKSAHKTCDYSVYPFRARRLARTVHLETRCDGEAHDGCQAGCLLYWKEDWLKPANGAAPERREVLSEEVAHAAENTIWSNVRQPYTEDGTPTYICQMTQIPHATAPIAWWDPRQYLEDYLSGNVPLKRLLAGLIYWMYYGLSQAGIGVGRPMRWLYDKIGPRLWGSYFPRKLGVIPEGQPTPTVKLNLQPGEVVRVKPHLEILRTVDAENRNRGMHWDAELVPYCGGTYKVLKRVTRIIGEQTGKMQEMKNPCIILDSVVCQARYSSCRMFCPKSMYPYWREIWLERVSPDAAGESAVEEKNLMGTESTRS